MAEGYLWLDIFIHGIEVTHNNSSYNRKSIKRSTGHIASGTKDEITGNQGGIE